MGSLARFAIGRLVAVRWKKSYPLATFVINISGALLLGIVANLGLDRNYILLFADGFLGAYTTFSTFMFEGVDLIKRRATGQSLSYIVLSIILGLTGYIGGMIMVRLFKCM